MLETTDQIPVTKQVIKNRLSVVERLYFQNHIDRESPVDYGGKFSIFLDSNEQPYQRNLTIGESWVKLDFGWLSSSPGMFELTNNSKDVGVEVAYAQTPLEGLNLVLESLIAVNEVNFMASIRNALGANIEAYVRSKSGTVKISLIAFPK